MSDTATTAPKGKAAAQSSLAKLVENSELVKFAKMDEFLELVNLDPPLNLVKNHPMASGVKYMPIDKVEMLLTKIFQRWRVEILREGQLLNSIFATVRLHYLHPITGEWEFQDGVGAMPIQVDKGKNASQLEWIKSDAIQKGLPAAESYAVKDAAEKIGRIFGKDLNRKDTLAFSPSYKSNEITVEYEEETKWSEVVEAINAAIKRDEFTQILSNLTPEQKREATPLINQRIKELKNAEVS